MSNSTPPKKVFLQTFEDWARWDEEFQTKAISLHLWGYIDPESDMLMMQRPERPDIGLYYRRIPARISDPDYVPQSGRQTRFGGQSSQTISQSPSEPVMVLPETIDPNQRAQNLSELTAEDRATYTFQWKIYEQDYKEYKEQENSCDKLKAWVTDSVDYGLRQSSCRPMWDLPTWYANLKNSVGATEREQQAAARIKYQAAIVTLPKIPKDFAGWITGWEMATNHALAWRTGGVEDPNTWFDDVSKAIQPVLGGWVSIYAGIYKDKLENGTLTIGEVAKDLRREAKRRNLLQPSEKAYRPSRGAFGPTFAGQSAPSQLPAPEKETTPQKQPTEAPGASRKRKAKDADSSRRKRASTVNEPDATCRACDGSHQLARCYYAFPKLAPELFKERKLTRDAFEHRFQTDETLRDEIEHVNKTGIVEDLE